MLLRFEDHGDVGLMPGSDFGFAREAVAIPVVNGEFMVAMRHYPIVFAVDEQASPIALVAMRKDQNLFVEPDGSWKAGSYIPAYVRRYPFIVMETEDRTQHFLSVDRGSERFVASVKDHEGARSLFDDVGRPTMVAQSAMGSRSIEHAMTRKSCNSRDYSAVQQSDVAILGNGETSWRRSLRLMKKAR